MTRLCTHYDCRAAAAKELAVLWAPFLPAVHTLIVPCRRVDPNVPLVDQAPGGRTVHVLHTGRALCGLQGVPRDWPREHVWVPLVAVADANCPGCLDVAKREAA